KQVRKGTAPPEQRTPLPQNAPRGTASRSPTYTRSSYRLLGHRPAKAVAQLQRSGDSHRRDTKPGLKPSHRLVTPHPKEYRFGTALCAFYPLWPFRVKHFLCVVFEFAIGPSLPER